jgi:hypothetical protein
LGLFVGLMLVVGRSLGHMAAVGGLGRDGSGGNDMRYLNGKELLLSLLRHLVSLHDIRQEKRRDVGRLTAPR